MEKDKQLNYVKQVSRTYTPVVYKNTGNLNEYLKQNCIINQTRHQLSDNEIELLALGVDFNITLPEHEDLMNAARLLRNQDMFYIMQSADNKATVLWNIVDYEAEAHRQLFDKKTYATVCYYQDKNKSRNKWYGNLSAEEKSYESGWYYDTILNALWIQRNEFVRHLEEKGFINSDTSRNMQMKKEGHVILPHVSFLPDVTKPLHRTTGTLQSTAIVHTQDGPLYLLEDYLAKVAYPIMDWVPGTFQNLTHLINGIQSKFDSWKDRAAVSSTTQTISCCDDGHSTQYLGVRVADAGNICPSIDVKQGIAAAFNVYQRNYNRLWNKNFDEQLLPPVDPATFRNILQFIFDNNFLTFKNKGIFRQKKGAPIGNRISVFVAHCYMYSITNHLIEYPPKWLLMFKRFMGEFFFLICHHPDHGKNVLQNVLRFISKDGSIRYELDYYDKGRRLELKKQTKKRNYDASLLADIFHGHIPRFMRHCIILNVCISFDHDRLSFHSNPYVKHLERHHHRANKDSEEHFKSIVLYHCSGLKSNSSSDRIFWTAAKAVLKQFLNRGYSNEECYAIFNEINDREHLSGFSRNGYLPAIPSSVNVLHQK